MFKDSGEMNRRVATGVGVGSVLGAKVALEITQATSEAAGKVLVAWHRNAILPYMWGAWVFLIGFLMLNWDDLFNRRSSYSEWQGLEMIVGLLFVNTLHAIAMNLKKLRAIHPYFAVGYKFAWMFGTIVAFVVTMLWITDDLRTAPEWYTQPKGMFAYLFCLLVVWPLLVYQLARALQKDWMCLRIFQHYDSNIDPDNVSRTMKAYPGLRQAVDEFWNAHLESLPSLLKPTGIQFITVPLILYIAVSTSW